MTTVSQMARITFCDLPCVDTVSDKNTKITFVVNIASSPDRSALSFCGFDFVQVISAKRLE